ncbi:hypothetical protein [Alicyclobacillus fodiniaquatilis]|uniref:Uncharacterized protein n=1 Tax=Alicyclobacillus fodiniaquatilis TaxID=1661150 RepID=A0ABW4JEN9_9BACL
MALDEAHRYEHFVRGAFRTVTGVDVDRGEDPGCLADADYVGLNAVAKVKVGTGYAMAMYNSHIRKGPNCSSLNQTEYDRMDTIIEDVLNAVTIAQINQYITEYRNNFFSYL